MNDLTRAIYTRICGPLIILTLMLPGTGCGVRRGKDIDSAATLSQPPVVTPSKYAHLLPERTRYIDVRAFDPCEVLTDKQSRELQYDLGYARPPLPTTDLVHGGPACTFSSNGGSGGADRSISTMITFAVTEGAEVWITDPLREPKEVRALQIDPDDNGAFHALVLLHPIVPDNCMVVVDTSAGQALQVSSTSTNGKNVTSHEPYCQEAVRVATMALQTMLAPK